MKLDAFIPAGESAGKRPAILFIHGGGWVGGDKRDFRPFIPKFTEAGYACFSAAYRLVGKDGSNAYPAPADDVREALRWLRAHAGRFGIDPQRIAACGASAGGHLASLLGTEGAAPGESDPGRAAAVIDIFGPSDLTPDFRKTIGGEAGNWVQNLVDGLLGKPAAENQDLAKKVSPLFHVTKDAAPHLIVHGDMDPIVPVDQSVRYHAALEKAGVATEFLRFPDEGHSLNQPANQARFYKAALAFLAKHLKP